MQITVQALEGGIYVPKSIEAKPVVIPGFEEIQFGIHKSLKGPGWTVTEVSSGLAVTTDYLPRKTRKEAIENVLTRMEAWGQTQESLKVMIEKVLKQLKLEEATK